MSRARPSTRPTWPRPAAPHRSTRESRREARNPHPSARLRRGSRPDRGGRDDRRADPLSAGVRLPVVGDSPKRIAVELQDAQAVEAGQGQSVRVAGVQIGQIAGVHLEDGIAVVELDIESRYGDMVRADATALLRPKTALKDMFLEVDPGHGRVLPEGGRIGVANTAPDVDADEISPRSTRIRVPI